MTDDILRLAAALEACCADVLDVHHRAFPSPIFARPDSADSVQWTRDEKWGVLFEPKPYAPQWEEGDSAYWPLMEESLALLSFQELLALTQTERTIGNRLKVVGAAYFEIHKDRPDVQLFWFLQTALLEPFFEQSKTFEWDRDGFRKQFDLPQLLSELTALKKVYIPLQGVEMESPFAIDGRTEVRRLTDDEISQGISFGAIQVTPEIGRIFVASNDQHAIIHQSKLTFSQEDLASEVFEGLLQRAIEMPDDLPVSRYFTDCLNLFDAMASVRAVDGWNTLECSLSSTSTGRGSIRDFSADGPRSRDSIISSSKMSELIDFWQMCQLASVRKNLTIAIARYSSSRGRHSVGESIVDLAIAAESLFGASTPGEATFRISLNAALFLGTAENPPSRVRALLKTAYSHRSAVVHGRGAVRNETLVTHRDELELTVRSAILRAMFLLKEDPNALDWSKLLDRVLDASVQSSSDEGRGSTSG